MKEEQNNPEELDTNFVVTSDFTIHSALFRLLICLLKPKNGEDMGFAVEGTWINQSHSSFELQDLADYFDIELPDFLNLRFELEKASLMYFTKNQTIQCLLHANGYMQLGIGTQLYEGKRIYYINFLSDYIFQFKDLPIIGGIVNGTDGVGLKSFKFQYIPGTGVKVCTEIRFCLGGKIWEFLLQFETTSSDQTWMQLGGNSFPQLRIDTEKFLSSDNEESQSSIHWININKSFRNLEFKRVGIELNDSEVKLYLAAGFTVSIITFDFYDLYVSLPLLQSGSVSFGLQGLSVTVKKPPVLISGGIYKLPDQDLYNGEVMLRISKFSLAALASYGNLPDGSETFFLYLMIGYPIGGPSYFFVNGLAFGIGINRRLKLPDIKDVTKFPFVSAVLGISESGLAQDTSPFDALLQLSDWVYPSKGDYFVCAGIRFLSFGLVESFALLTLEFGEHVRLSLLGVSTASIPPAITGNKVCPLVYVQMAFEVVIDVTDGIVQVLGALTREAYILDRNCHLTGGFGFCLWFKGDYAGDFLVTVGGCHHPQFTNVHYPELDEVGINWKISNRLKMSGSGYVAFTPACIMAGSNVELAYSIGDLKAWVRGGFSFYMKWKPFAYDARIYVSVGASYTVRFFGIHKTFSLEIGADLNVWGPEFSGKIKISWFIISFTIGFGSGSNNVPNIQWNEFSDSFLATSKNDTIYQQKRRKFQLGEVDKEGTPKCDIQIVEGLQREYKVNENNTVYIVAANELQLLAKSATPCTEIKMNDQQIYQYKEKIGIVPMGINDYQSCLHLTVTRIVNSYSGREELESSYFETFTQLEKIPPALYDKEEPDMNKGLISDVPIGVTMKITNWDSDFILPAPDRHYQMEDLMAGEKIDVNGFQWIDMVHKSGVDYSNQDVTKTIHSTFPENENRDNILKEVESLFYFVPKIGIGDIGSNPENYFWSSPTLKTLGSDEGGNYGKDSTILKL